MHTSWRGPLLPLLLLAAPAALARAEDKAPAGPVKLAPGKPAAGYGAGSGGCKSGGVTAGFGTELAKLLGGKEAVADGRLCAAAETLLGWERADQPPESVRTFLSWHHGLPTPFQRVIATEIETEDWRIIGQRFAAGAAPFLQTAGAPRYGIASKRVRRDVTKVVVLMLDAAVELAPLPRQLPAGGAAALTGKLAPGATNPKVYVCDPAGTFSAPPQTGDAVSAELRCGDRPGRLLAEVRADARGGSGTVARVEIACGGSPASEITVAPPQRGALDVASAERKLFDLGNAERAAAGLTPFAWSDELAKVARGAAESYRAANEGGAASSFDPKKALEAAGAASGLVLQNPAAALSVEEIAAITAISPVNRCNLLSREVNQSGVGVATTTDKSGNVIVFASQLMTRELPPVEVEAARAAVRAAVAQQREIAGAPALGQDALLDEVAQKYAELLARTEGQPPKAEESAVVAPLYKAYRTVNILASVKAEVTDIAKESGAVGAGKVIGVGVAGGTNRVLGNNAPYAVVLVAAPHEKPAGKGAPAAGKKGAAAGKKGAGK